MRPCPRPLYCGLYLTFFCRVCLLRDVLDAYDVIAVLHRPNAYNNGNFQLYRNSPELLKLFLKSKDWKVIFTNSNYIVFDEWWNNFPHGPPGIEDMSLVVGRAIENKELRFFNPMDHNTQWMVNDFFEQNCCFIDDHGKSTTPPGLEKCGSCQDKKLSKYRSFAPTSRRPSLPFNTRFVWRPSMLRVTPDPLQFFTNYTAANLSASTEVLGFHFLSWKNGKMQVDPQLGICSLAQLSARLQSIHVSRAKEVTYIRVNT